jgi:hypothetical protein
MFGGDAIWVVYAEIGNSSFELIGTRPHHPFNVSWSDVVQYPPSILDGPSTFCRMTEVS